MNYFNKLTEEEIEKYKPLLNKPIDEVKTELQTLVNNYYNSIINNNVELYNSTVAKLNQYNELNITDVNEYLNYCFVIASNQIIKQLYDSTSLSIFNPGEVDLKFRTQYTRKNEYYIKQEGLSDSELETIFQYIKEKHEIYCLSFLLNEDVVNNLKPKTILPGGLNSLIINTNYIRGEEVKKSGELYFALDKLFGNTNIEDGVINNGEYTTIK